MEFTTQQPIYLQIVELIYSGILSGQWSEGGRLPSVRELGAEIGVNPNTVMRAYERLQRDSIIGISRGVGNFVEMGARKIILDIQRAEFMDVTLPQIFEKMEQLGITLQQIIAQSTLYRPAPKDGKNPHQSDE
ncbi:MAG: GntR family transcriptional regulator [Mucinivorans sp.]